MKLKDTDTSNTIYGGTKILPVYVISLIGKDDNLLFNHDSLVSVYI